MSEIAAGGMGDVWRAHDDVLGRDVAVKVLRRDLSSDPRFVERFRREARDTAALSHPGIATVFDYGEEHGSAYLVMELVPGEPLSDLMARDGAVALPFAISLLLQAADALAVAHRSGLVHRDVKPGNLLVTADGRVKVTDFGIARAMDSTSLTATGSVMGTVQYMSPEHVAGQPTTPASDVYSLGVVAYELLCGELPFRADSHIGLAMAHLHDPPTPLPDSVPRALHEVIMLALAKDPAARPADAAAFAAELRAVGPAGRSTSDTRTRAVPTTAIMDTVGSATVPMAAVEPSATMPIAAVEPSATVPIAAVEPSGTVPMATVEPSATMPMAARRMPVAARNRRISRSALVGLVGAVAVVLVLIRVAGGDGSGTATDGSTTTQVTSTTAAVAPSAAAAVPATTTAAVTPSTVIDAASFLGRPKDDVIEELRALGYTVVERTVGRSAGDKNNTVVGIEPDGPVASGGTVTVVVASGKKDK
ncbi:MAG: serine/threonine protein kinase [Acidimicrobiia bacterium]